MLLMFCYFASITKINFILFYSYRNITAIDIGNRKNRNRNTYSGRVAAMLLVEGLVRLVIELWDE